MKLIISVIVTIIVASSGAAFGADGAALWAQHCASCHGKDGSGNTTMGKKLGVKDYSKDQGFSGRRSDERHQERQGQDEKL
jgi:mono/diheme cytochrome c family protein